MAARTLPRGARSDPRSSWQGLPYCWQVGATRIGQHCWRLPNICIPELRTREYSVVGSHAVPSVRTGSSRLWTRTPAWRGVVVRPERARPEYVAAFGEIARRIARSLQDLPRKHLPVRMYVAGGAALHFYTGARVSQDIDAAFSRRIALPDNLDVAYQAADGSAQLLYLDSQYSETFALMHEDAHRESESLALPDIDARILDIRLLTPVDLAVSKIARLSGQDREDIAALARLGLVSVKALRARAEAAIAGYVGDLVRLRGNIESACRIVNDTENRVARGAGR